MLRARVVVVERRQLVVAASREEHRQALAAAAQHVRQDLGALAQQIGEGRGVGVRAEEPLAHRCGRHRVRYVRLARGNGQRPVPVRDDVSAAGQGEKRRVEEALLCGQHAQPPGEFGTGHGGVGRRPGAVAEERVAQQDPRVLAPRRRRRRRR
ncbi:hypothetical protein RB201_09585 [Streptomyces sp. S1A(2023)]